MRRLAVSSECRGTERGVAGVAPATVQEKLNVFEAQPVLVIVKDPLWRSFSVPFFGQAYRAEKG